MREKQSIEKTLSYFIYFYVKWKLTKSFQGLLPSQNVFSFYKAFNDILFHWYSLTQLHSDNCLHEWPRALQFTIQFFRIKHRPENLQFFKEYYLESRSSYWNSDKNNLLSILTILNNPGAFWNCFVLTFNILIKFLKMRKKYSHSMSNLMSWKVFYCKNAVIDYTTIISVPPEYIWNATSLHSKRKFSFFILYLFRFYENTNIQNQMKLKKKKKKKTRTPTTSKMEIFLTAKSH